MSSKNKTWPERLNDDLEDAYFKARNEKDDPGSVLASVHFADGSFIEAELRRDNMVTVFLYHADEQNERDCPNIRGYIEEHLADWDTLAEIYDDALPEDEWTAHGFRNEADYWHYRLG